MPAECMLPLSQRALDNENNNPHSLSASLPYLSHIYKHSHRNTLMNARTHTDTHTHNPLHLSYTTAANSKCDAPSLNPLGISTYSYHTLDLTDLQCCTQKTHHSLLNKHKHCLHPLPCQKHNYRHHSSLSPGKVNRS
jgi:hypothetical protein